MKSQVQQPVIVPFGAGKMLEFRSVMNKLTGRQTGGAYYIFESVFGPGDGNRLHVHHREDEYGYVLQGALEIRLSDQTCVVTAGGMAHLPKHTPHAIRNPLETPSHYLFMTVPAGLEDWFDALEAARRQGILDDALYSSLSLDFGIEWLE